MKIFGHLPFLLLPTLINAIYQADSDIIQDINREPFSPHLKKRAAVNDMNALWPQATIPFMLDFEFTPVERKTILDVMKDWTNGTCIRFVESQPMYGQTLVYFQKITALQICHSYVGYTGDFIQHFYVHQRCLEPATLRTFAHEMGHLLGFFHEHNRPDRDYFIDIIWENIPSDFKNQFEKRASEVVDSFNSPYDFGSLMQYPLNEFSIDEELPTMRLKVRCDIPIGKNIKPSRSDIEQLNFLYGCVPYEPMEVGSGSGAMQYNYVRYINESLDHLYEEDNDDLESFSSSVMPLQEAAPSTSSVIPGMFDTAGMELLSTSIPPLSPSLTHSFIYTRAPPSLTISPLPTFPTISSNSPSLPSPNSWTAVLTMPPVSDSVIIPITPNFDFDILMTVSENIPATSIIIMTSSTTNNPTDTIQTMASILTMPTMNVLTGSTTEPVLIQLTTPTMNILLTSSTSTNSISPTIQPFTKSIRTFETDTEPTVTDVSLITGVNAQSTATNVEPTITTNDPAFILPTGTNTEPPTVTNVILTTSTNTESTVTDIFTVTSVSLTDTVTTSTVTDEVHVTDTRRTSTINMLITDTDMVTDTTSISSSTGKVTSLTVTDLRHTPTLIPPTTSNSIMITSFKDLSTTNSLTDSNSISIVPTSTSREVTLTSRMVTFTTTMVASTSRTVTSTSGGEGLLPMSTGVGPPLMAGHPVGLRTKDIPLSGRNYWMTCTQQNCRARLCPGKSFDVKRQQKCTNSMFTFMKAERGDDDSLQAAVHSGEVIALLPHNSIDVIINCANPNSKLCKVDHTCTNDTGPYIYCDKQISVISVPGKKKGDLIVNGDYVELRPALPEHNNSWMGCDVNNTRKCRHFNCDSSATSSQCEEFFVLYIL